MTTEKQTFDETLNEVRELAKLCHDTEVRAYDNIHLRARLSGLRKAIDKLAALATAQQAEPVAAANDLADYWRWRIWWLKNTAQQAEPFGWLYGKTFYVAQSPKLTDHIREHGDALYLHPEKREPLTDETISAILHNRHFDPTYRKTQSDLSLIAWWTMGIRDAEHAHGITPESDE